MGRTPLLLVLLGLLLLGAIGVGVWLWPRQPPAVVVDGPCWFADVTGPKGLHFVHDPGKLGAFQMHQIVGSGAALFDADGDGRLDIYLLQNGGPKSGSRNQFFRQRDDGTFENQSAGSGLDIAGHNMGVAVGDINNDGLPDVLVTQFGGVRLFLNQGNCKFVDVTEEAGLVNPQWAVSAAFVDSDRDGWLDLVIVNYVDYDPTWPCKSAAGELDYCAPKVFKGTPTRLFRNLAAGGKVKFEDRTVPSGLARVPGPGLGVVCADFDGDGWQDIFVANDGEPNRLWINQHNGTFKEEALLRGIAFDAMGQAQAGMGVAIGDVHNRGMLDVFVTHLTEEKHTLWQQGPRGHFQDRTGLLGLQKLGWRSTGWGVVLADFDNDGRLDLAWVNGKVKRGSDNANSALHPHLGPYAERNQLAMRAGDVFKDISLANPDLCGEPNVARGLSWGDIDNDGALDVLITTVGGPAKLLKNVARANGVAPGHWLNLRAIDPRWKRDALGAMIVVRVGEKRWSRLVASASSFLCSNDPRAHVGLGDVATVDAIEITWPDGVLEEFAGGAVDRFVTLRRGEGRATTKK